MKIIALYKAFSGEEWVVKSLDSIYPYVTKIVITMSDVSWIGGQGNMCWDVINNYKSLNDPDNKIDIINYNTTNQLEQCENAYNYINEHYKCDFIQLIDTDEIWDDRNYKKAMHYLSVNNRFHVFKTRLYTYIKDPTYRVKPIEPLKPVCFICPVFGDLGTEARACTLKPCFYMEDVYYHHMVLVRDTFNKALEKLVQSHVSESQSYADMSKWIPEVWNKLPTVNREWVEKYGGFHPAKGYERNWKSIEIVTNTFK